MMKVLFEKVAKNEPLSPQEQAEFAMFGDRLQNLESLMGGMIIPGTQSLQLNHPVISNPVWNTDPLHTLYVYRNTNLTVSTGTDQEISFEGMSGENRHFSWSSDYPKRLYVNAVARKIPLTVKGVVAYVVNGTGYRNAKLHGYDKNDVLLGSAVLFSLDAIASTDSVFPICYPFTFIADFPIEYLTVTTGHNVGSDLTMNFANIAISTG